MLSLFSVLALGAAVSALSPVTYTSVYVVDVPGGVRPVPVSRENLLCEYDRELTARFTTGGRI